MDISKKWHSINHMNISICCSWWLPSSVSLMSLLRKLKTITYNLDPSQLPKAGIMADFKNGGVYDNILDKYRSKRHKNIVWKCYRCVEEVSLVFYRNHQLSLYHGKAAMHSVGCTLFAVCLRLLGLQLFWLFLFNGGLVRNWHQSLKGRNCCINSRMLFVELRPFSVPSHVWSHGNQRNPSKSSQCKQYRRNETKVKDSHVHSFRKRSSNV